MPLRPDTPENILIDMCKGTVKGLDIEYEINPDGSFGDLILANPVAWEEWIKLPVRPQDLFINTPRGKIRIPTVVVCSDYDKIPKKKRRLSLQSIAERDNMTCQYTGKKLKKGEMSLDHITPKSKGGATSWTNLVLCDKTVNLRKGNKDNHEAGLKLLRQPKEPLPVAAVATIQKEGSHRDWQHFLFR